MGWIYVVLMVLVMMLTSYEIIWSYRELKKTKQKVDLVRFVAKIMCLVFLIIILFWIIDTVLRLSMNV